MSPHLGGLTFLVAVVVGCAHSVHQVHVSDFVPERSTKEGTVIHAHREQLTVLGLVNELAFVDLAVGDILAKCPSGIISGITTEYITDLGFLTWTHHLYLTGQCLPYSQDSDKAHHPAHSAAKKRPLSL